jgi:radical SAM superfamily enzyme YgiQ (UPF0313 family)
MKKRINQEGSGKKIPGGKKVLFVWPNKDSFGYKPIGISILSGIAQNLGWDTRLFDTTEINFGFMDVNEAGLAAKLCKPVDLFPYGHQKKKIDLSSKFIEILEEFKPDCLALSVLNDEFLIAAEISYIAKKIFPDLPVIWGGKYPTLLPEKVLLQFHADYVCIGEGLDPFGDFLIALSGNEDLFNIPNIWAKKNGKIIKNSIRPLRKDLDSLPYVDWELFNKAHFYKPYDGNVYVGGDHMLNWGCPYHCTYCINDFNHKLYNGKYLMRRYSVKRVIDELKYLKDKYKLNFFRFHDEDFLMRPLQNMRELSEAYRQEINVPFVIETNSKSVTEEKVEYLKNMNCVSASVAIETGDPQLRKELLKRVDTEEDIVKAFSLLNDAGIRTSAFIMFGIPFETRATYQKTIELTKKANVQYPSTGFFYPFEGTELRNIAIKEGFFDPDNKTTLVYQRDMPALQTPELSREELIEMNNVFVLYVKLPECYRPFIERSEKTDRIGINLRKKLLEVYDNTVFVNNGWYINDGKENTYLKELHALLNKNCS